MKLTKNYYVELEKSNNILSDHKYFKENSHVQWIKFFDSIEVKIKEHFDSNNLKLESEEEDESTETVREREEENSVEPDKNEENSDKEEED